MTLQTQWMEQLVAWCKANQKEHAWHQAKHLAELYPQELESLPKLLILEMKSKNESNK